MALTEDYIYITIPTRYIETYNRREKMLNLREQLIAVEEDRLAGRTGCTVDELDKYLDEVISEV